MRIWIFLFAFFLMNASMHIKKVNESIPKHLQNIKLKKPCLGTDTVFFVPCNSKQIQVKIICPSKEPKAVLLLLPGWNYADLDWITKTNVVQNALNGQFAVMFVEMGKSVYMDSFYPNMRADYRNYPTRNWLFDSVLTPLNKFGWFTENSNSFVMGLSTGGRGAVVLGLEHPKCFKAVAGLSGDYNPLLDKTDGLMVNCLGSYDKNAFRWKGTNNISLRAGNFQTNLFLAHGFNDQIVSYLQTEDLIMHLPKGVSKLHEVKSLKNEKIKIRDYVLLSSKPNNQQFTIRSVFIKDANHDYIFWNESGIMALKFFNDLML